MKATFYYLLEALIVLNVCLISSCNGKKPFEINSYQGGQIKELIISDSTGLKKVYSFYENGEIKEIHTYNKDQEYLGEQLWFYPNGVLDRKASFLNGESNGNGYFFYDTTGTLKGARYYRNDKEVFLGDDYWDDSIARIKCLIRFDDSGHVSHQKNFDVNGNLIFETPN